MPRSLIDFFKFYSRDFAYNTGVVSIRSGFLLKEGKGWLSEVSISTSVSTKSDSGIFRPTSELRENEIDYVLRQLSRSLVPLHSSLNIIYRILSKQISTLLGVSPETDCILFVSILSFKMKFVAHGGAIDSWRVYASVSHPCQ